MSPVNANEIGKGGNVVVVVLVVVDVDVLEVDVVVSLMSDVGVVAPGIFGSIAGDETAPWSRFDGGRKATGGKVARFETEEDSVFEHATRARHMEIAVSRPRIH